MYWACGLSLVAHVSHMARMLCICLTAEPDLSCLDHNYFLGEVGRCVGTAAGAAVAAAAAAAAAAIPHEQQELPANGWCLRT
jgi:hypothetical protein